MDYADTEMKNGTMSPVKTKEESRRVWVLDDKLLHSRLFSDSNQSTRQMEPKYFSSKFTKGWKNYCNGENNVYWENCIRSAGANDDKLLKKF